MSQTEKDKYYITSLIPEILKMDTNELIYQIDSETSKTNYGYQRGKLGLTYMYYYIYNSQQGPIV